MVVLKIIANKKNQLFCVLAGLFLLTGMVYFFQYGDSGAQDRAATAIPIVTNNGDAHSNVYVYITGAIRKPGVYALSADSRTFDVILAAGDCLPYADRDNINMSEQVQDGQHIHIPYNYDSNIPVGTGSAAGLINLNTATEEQLKTLPGVGSSTAKAIIEYRETETMFGATEDLEKVKGIGPAKFAKLKDKVTL